MSLDRMNTKTQDLSQKEVIRLALGSHETNTELGKALQDLEQYGEVSARPRSRAKASKSEGPARQARARRARRAARREGVVLIAADVLAGRG
jgi:hypothetical protein